MASAASEGSSRSEPSGVRLALTLGVAGLLSGLALVATYEATLPTITANKAAALQKAAFDAVPASRQMSAPSLQKLIVEGGAWRVAAEGDAGEGVYGVYGDGGELLGYAIPGQGPGFQDVIAIIYGYDPERRVVVGMQVLESRETPGLGDKIYKDPAFAQNFEALAVEPEVVAVKHGDKLEANEIDAITGATISSKAVARIIQTTNELWLSRLPAAADAPPLEQRAAGEGEAADGPSASPSGGAP